MKRYGVTGGVKDMFSSLSSSMPDNNQYRPSEGLLYGLWKRTQRNCMS